jgi:hypothetical protein
MSDITVTREGIVKFLLNLNPNNAATQMKLNLGYLKNLLLK